MLLRKLAVPAFGVVLATAGFGYMASNQSNPQFAGEGSATVSGFSVYAQNFESCGQLDEAGGVWNGYHTSQYAANPTTDPNASKICAVSFFATPSDWQGEKGAITETGAQIKPSSGNWYKCVAQGSTSVSPGGAVQWLCDTSGTPFNGGSTLNSVDYEITGQSYASNVDNSAQLGTQP